MRRFAIALLLLAVGCTRPAHHAADGGAPGGDGDAAMAPDDAAAVGDMGQASGADLATGLDPATYHARGDAALAALLVGYWSPSANYLNAEAPSTEALTGYWTFAQPYDAVLDGVERTKGAHFIG